MNHLSRGESSVNRARAPGPTAGPGYNMKLVPALFMGLMCSIGLSATAQAQSESEVFREHERSLFKVEVIETLSQTPYVIGTAFVARTGLLVTNYHVVNDVIFSPEDYSIRLIDVADMKHDAQVIRVDPVNDLAVLEATLEDVPPLDIAPRMPDVGDPVFSLGFPSDLSGTLVAGTFSGPIEQAIGSLLHYSGSLSPGMSGGPTLDESGSVIGVNVSTSGNQLSFLVSAEAVQRLLEEDPGSDDLLQQCRDRLMLFQEQVHRTFLTEALPVHELAPFQVATFSEDVADCTASPLQPDGYDFTGVIYSCAPTDMIWLDPEDSVAPLSLKHVLLVAEGMSRLRFSGLYTEWFQDVWWSEAPESRWASDYVCRTRNVRNSGGVKLLVSQCWRRREGLDGLYDVFAKAAVLGVSDRGLVTTMTLAGTTLQNGQDLVSQVVESVRWER